ncbi:hypothetical protein HMPREF9550_04043 [Escherichia coli MS 187-1]|nr:hypothetical protein HMPREF9550_04043 [Escherichia coli MS 187-1]
MLLKHPANNLKFNVSLSSINLNTLICEFYHLDLQITPVFNM